LASFLYRNQPQKKKKKKKKKKKAQTARFGAFFLGNFDVVAAEIFCGGIERISGKKNAKKTPKK
jgi:hypothetical protein